MRTDKPSWAENESLTRKLDERDDAIKRMAERASRRDLLRHCEADARWRETQYMKLDTFAPIRLESENAELQAEIVALRKELFDRKAEAIYKADVEKAVDCWAEAESVRLRAENATFAASVQHLRTSSEHWAGVAGKLRTYVREHGPCECCENGMGCKCPLADEGRCPEHDEWAAIREV